MSILARISKCILWFYVHGVNLCYIFFVANFLAAGWAAQAVLQTFERPIPLRLGDAGERKPVWLITFPNWTMPQMETRVSRFLNLPYLEPNEKK